MKQALYNPLPINNSSTLFAFGTILDNRNFGNSPRVGYQGSEKDNEIKGDGNSYTTEYRILDTRLGRWLSVDPEWNAWESYYASMGNSPIWHNDILGNVVDYGKKGTKEYKDNRRSAFFAKMFNKDLRRKFKEWETAKDNEGNDITYHLNRVKEKPTLRSGGELQALDANNINVKYDGSGLEQIEKEVDITIKKKKEIVDINKGNNEDGKSPLYNLKKVVPGSDIIVNALPIPDEFSFFDATGMPEFPPFTVVNGSEGAIYEDKPGYANPVQNTGSIILTVPNYRTPVNLTLQQRSGANWDYKDSKKLCQIDNYNNRKDSEWKVTYYKQIFRIKFHYSVLKF